MTTPANAGMPSMHTNLQLPLRSPQTLNSAAYQATDHAALVCTGR